MIPHKKWSEKNNFTTMIDSYNEEVRKKRQRNLFFWLLVLIFAIGLFFFFKGKYISLNVNWNTALSESGNTFSGEIVASESGNQPLNNSLISFHSFGIVNVKVTPDDSKIFLNNDPYSNNSKPRVDYGKYVLQVQKDDYIPGEMHFEISDEKNFYIDDIFLLKKPEYKEFDGIADGRIINIADNAWLGYSGSGMLLFENNFLTGTVVNRNALASIGGGKFLSGGVVVEYNTLGRHWAAETNPIINAFVRRCEGIIFHHGLYHCHENNTAMTTAGRAFTGVVDSGNNFLRLQNTLLLGDIAGGNAETFSLSGAEISGNHFFEIDSTWYTHSGGHILPVRPTPNFISPFQLGLESINFIQNYGKELFFIGNHDGKKTLAIVTKSSTFPIRYFEFPDIELNDVRIYEKK